MTKEIQKLIETLNCYDCFKDNKDKYYLIAKEQFKEQLLKDSLSLKIGISNNYVLAMKCLPLTREQAKTRKQIVADNKLSSDNWFSACLSLNSVKPFNKNNYGRDGNEKPIVYWRNDFTNVMLDKLDNATLLEQKEQ